MYRIGCLFDKSAHLFVDLPAMKAFFSGRQTYPSRFKLSSLVLRTLKALCMDVFVPGVFGVPIGVIIIGGGGLNCLDTKAPLFVINHVALMK
jgi:hypothetical protein